MIYYQRKFVVSNTTSKNMYISVKVESTEKYYQNDKGQTHVFARPKYTNNYVGTMCVNSTDATYLVIIHIVCWKL